MPRPGSSLEENPFLGPVVERALETALTLAQRSQGEAAQQLAGRLGIGFESLRAASSTKKCATWRMELAC
jgi:hypothetical protein